MPEDIEKRAAKKRAWRLAHREQVRASKRAHYWKHRERERAKSKAKYRAHAAEKIAMARANYAVNKERIRARTRQLYALDPQRFLENNRKYRAANLDVFRERDKEYQKAHQDRDPERFLEKIRRGNNKRRALQFGAFVETVERSVVFRRDKGKCGICHLRVDIKGDWHVDHVIPLSKGGVHSYANVQLAHARCNLSKLNKLPTGQLGLFQKSTSPGGR